MRKEPRCSEVPNISILDLGKLGAVAAGCYASRGFRVIGADTDQNVVDSCNKRAAVGPRAGHGDFGSPSGGA